MSAMATQVTSVSIVSSTVCSGTDQRKHQNSASLAFVKGIDRQPVDSPHKEPVTHKMFAFDEVIMFTYRYAKTWNITITETTKLSSGRITIASMKTCTGLVMGLLQTGKQGTI